MEFVKAYVSSSDEDDVPNQHEETANGRKRQFPHVDGQYATSVFFRVPSSPELDAYLKMIDGASRLTPIPTDELHVSLSRTVPIVHAQKASLLEELRKATQKVMRRRRQSSLDVRIGDQGMALVNDDGSRTFVALSVRDGVGVLGDLVDAVSSVFVRHGLPGYYSEKIMHVSVAWCLGDGRTDDCFTLGPEGVSPYQVSVPQLLCKIGCKEHLVLEFK